MWFLLSLTRGGGGVEDNSCIFLQQIFLTTVGLLIPQYVNVSVLIKFSQKTIFYLNYHKFSINSYVLDVY